MVNQVFTGGTVGAEGVCCHGNTAGLFHMSQQLRGGKAGLQLFIGAEEEKVTFAGGILHTENDTEAIVLHAFLQKVTNIHGVVVGDADTGQSPLFCLDDDIL